MRMRGLLIVGVGAIAASLLLGVVGVASGWMSGWAFGTHGSMMGSVFGGGRRDIGMDRVVTIAQSAAASYPGGGLVADEVIEFSDNYYASIREKSTGIGAFEILIDRANGNVIREPGPDMMWNTKYSVMRGGMMGSWGGRGRRCRVQFESSNSVPSPRPDFELRCPTQFHCFGDTGAVICSSCVVVSAKGAADRLRLVRRD